VVFDVSALLHDRQVLGLAMLGVTSALTALVVGREQKDPELVPRRFFVFDECWGVVAEPASVRFLQASWKLCRAWGVSNLAVLHKVADLGAQADSSSAESKIAMGLLADTATHVVHRTHSSEVEVTAAALALTRTERGELDHLRPGTALWKVGRRSSFVRLYRSSVERGLSDTNSRLAG
jgi:hypothetical protein